MGYIWEVIENVISELGHGGVKKVRPTERGRRRGTGGGQRCRDRRNGQKRGEIWSWRDGAVNI